MGVAGRPESYFRKDDMHAFAEAWQILKSNGTHNFADYLLATRTAGSTDNGVLAIRIMWGTLEEVTANLERLHPNLAGDELKLLEKAFGRLKFIYLYREDVLAQAISLYRAEQTGYWHSPEGQLPPQQPRFGFEAIHSLVEMLDQHNLAWEGWFKKVGVEPSVVSYENLAADPRGVTKEILRFLDIELPPSARLEASNQRLADETTLIWTERYLKELGNRAA